MFLRIALKSDSKRLTTFIDIPDHNNAILSAVNKKFLSGLTLKSFRQNWGGT